MIGLQSDDACSHCPLTLACWGDTFDPASLLLVNGRFCLGCDALYFESDGETYICRRYMEQGASGESLIKRVVKEAVSRHGTQMPIVDACGRAKDCLKHYKDKFSVIY